MQISLLRRAGTVEEAGHFRTQTPLGSVGILGGSQSEGAQGSTMIGLSLEGWKW